MLAGYYCVSISTVLIAAPYWLVQVQFGFGPERSWFVCSDNYMYQVSRARVQNKQIALCRVYDSKKHNF